MPMCDWSSDVCSSDLRMDWLDLLAVQGTCKSLLQYHSAKAPHFSHLSSVKAWQVGGWWCWTAHLLNEPHDR